MDVLVGALIVAVAGLAAALLIAQRSPRTAEVDVGRELARVADAVAALHTQAAVLGEKVGLVGERVALLEQHQDGLREGIVRLGAGMERTSTLAGGLRDSTEIIRGELQKASDELAAIHAGALARRQLEEQTATSIRRLEQVIAGSSSRGAAGENLVDLAFSRLPPEWQARNYRLGARVVEFALRLPNGLVLPIDSKWPATALLEQFAAAAEPAERARLKAQIEREARAKASEAAQYLDPELTLGFAVAVVPDAVYELCGGVQADCVRENVVLVGHSMFVPYLLLVFQTVLRSAHDIDLERLAAQLEVVDRSLRGLHDEIEGRLSKAITMLSNSRDGLRGSVARASTGLAALNAHAEFDFDPLPAADCADSALLPAATTLP